jgi:hypothetical protein
MRQSGLSGLTHGGHDIRPFESGTPCLLRRSVGSQAQDWVTHRLWFRQKLLLSRWQRWLPRGAAPLRRPRSRPGTRWHKVRKNRASCRERLVRSRLWRRQPPPATRPAPRATATSPVSTAVSPILASRVWPEMVRRSHASTPTVATGGHGPRPPGPNPYRRACAAATVCDDAE